MEQCSHSHGTTPIFVELELSNFVDQPHSHSSGAKYRSTDRVLTGNNPSRRLELTTNSRVFKHKGKHNRLCAGIQNQEDIHLLLSSYGIQNLSGDKNKSIGAKLKEVYKCDDTSHTNASQGASSKERQGIKFTYGECNLQLDETTSHSRGNISQLPTNDNNSVELWHCRGAASQGFMQAFKDMVDFHKPTLVVLTETKLSGVRATEVISSQPGLPESYSH